MFPKVPSQLEPFTPLFSINVFQVSSFLVIIPLIFLLSSYSGAMVNTRDPVVREVLVSWKSKSSEKSDFNKIITPK